MGTAVSVFLMREQKLPLSVCAVCSFAKNVLHQVTASVGFKNSLACAVILQHIH